MCGLFVAFGAKPFQITNNWNQCSTTVDMILGSFIKHYTKPTSIGKPYVWVCLHKSVIIKERRKNYFERKFCFNLQRPTVDRAEKDLCNWQELKINYDGNKLCQVHCSLLSRKRILKNKNPLYLISTLAKNQIQIIW